MTPHLCRAGTKNKRTLGRLRRLHSAVLLDVIISLLRPGLFHKSIRKTSYFIRFASVNPYPVLHFPSYTPPPASPNLASPNLAFLSSPSPPCNLHAPQVRTMPSASFFFCFLLLLAPARTSTTHHVLSPLSRTRVAESLLSERVPSRHRHPAGLSAHLFEWNPHLNLLRSSHLTLDLSAHRSERVIRHQPYTRFELNGLPYSLEQQQQQTNSATENEATITTSADGTVDAVFHDADLIHVWGSNGLRIAPLPHHNAPNRLFVAERLAGDLDSKHKYDMDAEEDKDAADARENGMVTLAAAAGLPPPPQPRNVDSMPSPTTSVVAGDCARGVPHYIEIAVAYDNSLCRFYNYSPARTFAMLAVLFEMASRPFIQDTCVRLALTFVDGHCRDPNDPYAPLRSQTSIFLALSFISIWMTPERRAIPRDVVYFIGGFNDGSPSLGFGFQGEIGGVCSPLSFGWVEGIIPGVFAHDLGHTLSASHNDGGLMLATYEPGIIIPRFSQASLDRIIPFIDDNPLSSCLSTEAPANPLVPITLNVQPKPAVVLLPEYGTCDVSRRRFNVLTCTTPRFIGRVQPPPNATSIGDLRVVAWQDFGEFHVRVHVVRKKTSEIREFRGVQHLNASFVRRNFGLSFRDDGRDMNVTQTGALDRSSIRIRWPRPRLTCCDQRLYVFLRVKWCEVGGGVCGEVFSRLSRKIPCRSPCFGVQGGRVLKMSAGRRCPACAGPV